MSDESIWSTIQGARDLRERLGWWPTFHDATVRWARIEDSHFEIRLALNEGGPRDSLTLRWEPVPNVSIEGWEHGDAEINVSGSTLERADESGRLRLTLQTNVGLWTMMGKAFAVVDFEFGPGEVWLDPDTHPRD